jgi:hypothetical protein
VASIERTAYPRFRRQPHAREFQDLFTPTQEEVQFGRKLVRNDEHFFAAVVLLKCLQFNTWGTSPNSLQSLPRL